MKHDNIFIIGIPEGETDEKGIENLFEKVMMENFPNLMKEKVMQVQEAQNVSIKMNSKRPTLRHIIIQMANFTLAGMAQWLSTSLWIKGQLVLFPVWSTCLGCGPGPQ